MCSLDWCLQHAISIGQDIEGNVLFPEDNYEATSDYQEEGPQPEDKVYINMLQAINIWFIWLKYNGTTHIYFNVFVDLNNFCKKHFSLSSGNWFCHSGPATYHLSTCQLHVFLQLLKMTGNHSVPGVVLYVILDLHPLSINAVFCCSLQVMYNVEEEEEKNIYDFCVIISQVRMFWVCYE